MSDEKKTTIHCRRTEQDYEVGVHKQCPYCWGSKKDVATGAHENFCDFQPGEDPVNFGFPEDKGRLRNG